MKLSRHFPRHFSGSTKGFSLVELLVVMAIMITLGGVGYQAMSGHKVTARDTARTTALGNLQEALNAYYSKNNFFPQPAIRYAVEGTAPIDTDGEIDIDPLDIKIKNVWGFRPKKEALPTCKIAWDSQNNTVALEPADNFACGGLIYDRSGEVPVGWKGTLTEFSGKNSLAKKKDVGSGQPTYTDYMNPITDRDLIVAPFDKTYFDNIPVDPTFGTGDVFKQLGLGNIIYSAYRKGLDIENNKNTDIGASQYQLATTLEHTENSVDSTTYIIGNYIRSSKPYPTKIGTGNTAESKQTYLPYSLIGSQNAVLMNDQKINEAPSPISCPENDSYTDHAPCVITDEFTRKEPSDISFDGTDITSGYMGIPYPVVF